MNRGVNKNIYNLVTQFSKGGQLYTMNKCVPTIKYSDQCGVNAIIGLDSLFYLNIREVLKGIQVPLNQTSYLQPDRSSIIIGCNLNKRIV